MMHSKSDNIEIIINDEENEVIKEFFYSLKKRYQNNSESVKGSEFAFDNVNLLCYKCHKINPNRGGSYIDCTDWIKNKKTKLNPINEKDNKCFQYAVTVALYHEEIEKHTGRIKKIKPFINKYKCEGINFPSEKEGSTEKNFEKNNVTIAFNDLYVKKEKNISCLCSKT